MKNIKSFNQNFEKKSKKIEFRLWKSKSWKEWFVQQSLNQWKNSSLNKSIKKKRKQKQNIWKKNCIIRKLILKNQNIMKEMSNHNPLQNIILQRKQLMKKNSKSVEWSMGK